MDASSKVLNLPELLEMVLSYHDKLYYQSRFDTPRMRHDLKQCSQLAQVNRLWYETCIPFLWRWCSNTCGSTFARLAAVSTIRAQQYADCIEGIYISCDGPTIMPIHVRYPRLRKLSISGHADSRWMGTISNLLCPSIAEVDLLHCRIDIEIFEILKSNCPTLKSLDLPYSLEDKMCNSGDEALTISEPFVKTFTEYLKSAIHLEKLNLCILHKIWNVSTLRSIAEISTLKRLHLDRLNDVTSMALIHEALQTTSDAFSSLEELYIKFDIDKANYLISRIPHLKKLGITLAFTIAPQHITNFPTLLHLSHLSIILYNVTDLDVKELVTNCPCLETLWLRPYVSTLTEKSLLYIVENLRTLTNLSISGSFDLFNLLEEASADAFSRLTRCCITRCPKEPFAKWNVSSIEQFASVAEALAILFKKCRHFKTGLYYYIYGEGYWDYGYALDEEVGQALKRIQSATPFEKLTTSRRTVKKLSLSWNGRRSMAQTHRLSMEFWPRQTKYFR